MKQNDSERIICSRINGLFSVDEPKKQNDLNDWEKIVQIEFAHLFDLDSFEETKENENMGKFCIERVDNSSKWKSYILLNGEKKAYNDYDDFYDLCIHIINHISNEELREECIRKFPTREEIVGIYLYKIKAAQVEKLRKITDIIEEAYRNGVPLKSIKIAVSSVLKRIVYEEKINKKK